MNFGENGGRTRGTLLLYYNSGTSPETRANWRSAIQDLAQMAKEKIGKNKLVESIVTFSLLIVNVVKNKLGIVDRRGEEREEQGKEEEEHHRRREVGPQGRGRIAELKDRIIEFFKKVIGGEEEEEEGTTETTATTTATTATTKTATKAPRLR